MFGGGGGGGGVEERKKTRKAFTEEAPRAQHAPFMFSYVHRELDRQHRGAMQFGGFNDRYDGHCQL